MMVFQAEVVWLSPLNISTPLLVPFSVRVYEELPRLITPLKVTVLVLTMFRL